MYTNSHVVIYLQSRETRIASIKEILGKRIVPMLYRNLMIVVTEKIG